MKRNKTSWFQLYPDSPAASRLSVAGGGVRVLSILLLVAAVLCSAAALWVVLRLTLARGMDHALYVLLDDGEEGVLALFLLWGGYAACRYAMSVLHSKAELLARREAPAQAQWDEAGR